VGSADFLGNPVQLVSSLGTGFKDFFYEPAAAIVKRPKEFGHALAKGTSSLMKKTTFAIFNTASKLTGTVAKGKIHSLIVSCPTHCSNLRHSWCHTHYG